MEPFDLDRIGGPAGLRALTDELLACGELAHIATGTLSPALKNLLDFGAAAADVAALTAAAAAAGVPLAVEAIDQPEIAGQYGRLLVLVRPDGQVAWRADTAPADAPHLFDVVRGAAA